MKALSWRNAQNVLVYSAEDMGKPGFCTNHACVQSVLFRHDKIYLVLRFALGVGVKFSCSFLRPAPLIGLNPRS